VAADLMELAKWGVAALTPLATLMVGIIVMRMGTQIEAAKQLNQQLLRKRLELFEQVAPKLNDIFCFYQAVGHWAELSPEEVIKRKRAIDRIIQVDRFLFESEFWDAYQQFDKAHFDLFAAVGQPARLRLDAKHIRERIGEAFKNEWSPLVSANAGDHAEQRRHYESLMNVLGKEVRGNQ
jgi:hypothetical protein